MRQEPQPLICRRQCNGLAYPAERDLTRHVADGEAVAWPLADHGAEPPGAVRVAVGFDPGYAALNPGLHCEGQPWDEDEVVQLEEKVEGAGWVEGTGREEWDFGGVRLRCVFVGSVRRACGCGLGT